MLLAKLAIIDLVGKDIAGLIWHLYAKTIDKTINSLPFFLTGGRVTATSIVYHKTLQIQHFGCQSCTCCNSITNDYIVVNLRWRGYNNLVHTFHPSCYKKQFNDL